MLLAERPFLLSSGSSRHRDDTYRPGSIRLFQDPSALIVVPTHRNCEPLVECGDRAEVACVRGRWSASTISLPAPEWLGRIPETLSCAWTRPGRPEGQIPTRQAASLPSQRGLSTSHVLPFGHDGEADDGTVPITAVVEPVPAIARRARRIMTVLPTSHPYLRRTARHIVRPIEVDEVVVAIPATPSIGTSEAVRR